MGIYSLPEAIRWRPCRDAHLQDCISRAPPTNFPYKIITMKQQNSKKMLRDTSDASLRSQRITRMNAAFVQYNKAKQLNIPGLLIKVMEILLCHLFGIWFLLEAAVRLQSVSIQRQ